MAASTVAGNTSVVLVSSIGTKVYLSSVAYPGHIVTIQDYAGVASQGNPIVVSTTQDVYFADGSISTLLFNPNSYLTVSSKTPTTWQILNNVGFLTSLSNAFVETLTAENAFTTLTSSVKEYVSSSLINQVNVTNSLTLLGNVDILGNITVSGTVDLFSTLNAKEDVSFSSGLTVVGAVATGSTLSVADEMTVSGYISTLNDITVSEGLTIDQSLYVQATLVPRYLSVQTLGMNSINVGGAFEVQAGMSIGSNLFLGDSLFGLSSLLAESSISVAGATTIQDDLQIQGNLQTKTLESFSSGYVSKEVSVSSLFVGGTLSTGNSLFVKGTLKTDGDTIVSSVVASGQVITNSLVVSGNAEISSITMTGNLTSIGDVSLFSSFHTSSLETSISYVRNSLNVKGHTSVSSFFSTFDNFYAGADMSIGSTLFTKGGIQVSGNLENPLQAELYGNVSTKSLYVFQNLTIEEDLSVPGTVTVGVLGASINIILSTLTLSNTFSVSNVATIPELQALSNTSNVFPKTVVAGGATDFGSFVSLNSPSINIRNSLQDFSETIDNKAISSVRVSTLYNTSILSNFLVGSASYINPTFDSSGYLIFASTNTYKTAIGSYSIYNNPLPFSSGANGGYYNPSGTPTWITVGSASAQSNSIQYSLDYGRSWNAALSGGFGVLPPPFLVAVGNDVVYMSTTSYNVLSPVWVATGYGAVGAASIQWSPDGKNWAPGAGSIFGISFYGNKLLYYPSPIESGVILAGGWGGFGNFGIRYSGDGRTWSQASAAFGSGEFICRDITATSGSFIAVGHDSFNTNKIYTAGIASYATGWSNLSNTPNVPTGTYNTIAYGNGYYVLGTSATSGNPATSIWITPNLGMWIPAASGGFTVATNKIVYDSYTSSFLAGGSNTGGSNLQYSINGINWFSVSTPFPSAISSLAGGILPLPDDTSKYFTANTETRFQTAVSTVSLVASTIKASSITAEYFVGDGSQITNLTTFSDKMGVSSIIAQYIALNSTFFTFGSTSMSNGIISSGVSLAPGNFLSSANLWLATGLDSLSNGNIQVTPNITDWTRATNTNFQYYGNAIVGNSNLFAPLFVATGADSVAGKTIQYSSDGYVWNPVVSGGFQVADQNGIYIGNTVATTTYLSTVLVPPFYVVAGPRWLVGGSASGTTSTLFYSDDGSNFYAATGSGDSLLNSVKKIKAANTYAFGLNNSNYLINSSNGIYWNQTSTTTQFTAIGYGSMPSLLNALYGFDALGSLYYSSDYGSNWLTAESFTGVFNTIDMVYNNQYWIAINSNQAFIASTVNGWQGINPSVFTGLSYFQSIFWDTAQSRWFLGGSAQSSINTLWTSTDGLSWQNMVSGGFSSGIITYGVGRAVIHTSSLVLAGGTGCFNTLQSPRAQILDVIGANFPPTPSIFTSTLLSFSNSLNVFSTTVYGLAFTSSPTQTYPFVAVGDGLTPQKTIARASNLDYDAPINWIPATTGGFSPAGYGAIYYSAADIWLAVGKAVASTATIQYSPDTANWFATNNTTAMSLGGRGIAKFRDSSSYPNRLVAVGESPFAASGYLNTIVYSDDGFNWTKADCNQGFRYAGYGAAAGIGTGNEIMVAVGAAYSNNPSTPNSLYSIQWSQDGFSWNPILSGGFTKAGYGIAFGKNNSGNNLWVAVGENDTPGSGTTTIQYSFDGSNWVNTVQDFYFAGYGVAYNPDSNVFVAVGKNLNNLTSVLYGFDGNSWYGLNQLGSGFQSQEAPGTALGIYSQQIITNEQYPFIEMPKFIAYERTNALSYPVPTLRLLSTQITLNEAMTINLSSQVMINTYIPNGSNTVTVQGDIQTSSLVYTGAAFTNANISVNSMIVSTLQLTGIAGINGNTITTPSWGYGYAVSSLANYIMIQNINSNPTINYNDTVFIKEQTNVIPLVNIGINNRFPTVELDVSGTVGCSSFSTAIYKQDILYFTPSDREYITSSNLAIFEGSNAQLVQGKNTIYSNPSSITFNSLLTVNFSTQRVGCYTNNPQFDFDVRSYGFISTLETQMINTGTLFFTLQSF